MESHSSVGLIVTYESINYTEMSKSARVRTKIVYNIEK